VLFGKEKHLKNFHKLPGICIPYLNIVTRIEKKYIETKASFLAPNLV
jgi:hypothetical protein